MVKIFSSATRYSLKQIDNLSTNKAINKFFNNKLAIFAVKIQKIASRSIMIGKCAFLDVIKDTFC